MSFEQTILCVDKTLDGSWAKSGAAHDKDGVSPSVLLVKYTAGTEANLQLKIEYKPGHSTPDWFVAGLLLTAGTYDFEDTIIQLDTTGNYAINLPITVDGVYRVLYKAKNPGAGPGSVSIYWAE